MESCLLASALSIVSVPKLMTKCIQKLGAFEKGKNAMIYGYARVSTATQGLDGNLLEDQVATLTLYGCQGIIQEAFTGKTMEHSAFQALLDKLKASNITCDHEARQVRQNSY